MISFGKNEEYSGGFRGGSTPEGNRRGQLPQGGILNYGGAGAGGDWRPRHVQRAVRSLRKWRTGHPHSKEGGKS